MKQILHFPNDKSYFGIDVHRYGVKTTDLEKLPIFDLFLEYSGESIFLTNGKESYIPIIDWESFCYDYILHGNYRIFD
jgi:hypothetical protein